MSKKIVISLFLAVCCLFFTACSGVSDGGGVNKLLAAVDSGDYLKASEVFRQDILGNTDREYQTRQALKERMNDAIEAYNAGTKSEVEVANLITTIDRVGALTLDSVDKANEKLSELQMSKAAFDSAEKLMAEKLYADALENYLLVIESDTNFELAQQKAAVAKSLYIAEGGTLIGEEYSENNEEIYQDVSDGAQEAVLLPLEGTYTGNYTYGSAGNYDSFLTVSVSDMDEDGFYLRFKDSFSGVSHGAYCWVEWNDGDWTECSQVDFETDYFSGEHNAYYKLYGSIDRENGSLQVTQISWFEKEFDGAFSPKRYFSNENADVYYRIDHAAPLLQLQSSDINGDYSIAKSTKVDRACTFTISNFDESEFDLDVTMRFNNRSYILHGKGYVTEISDSDYWYETEYMWMADESPMLNDDNREYWEDKCYVFSGYIDKTANSMSYDITEYDVSEGYKKSEVEMLDWWRDPNKIAYRGAT